ncbi:MAG: 5-methyltetrahydropteroyltriglutamate--homocysteine S-methyltransferase [Chloroflexi bacterium]|nr:5-methyltetrahydropteroyltriglutamate--homocysteine S-methyltransferase [Chloroflexota bacterium]|tara:strand:+ start:727 stop:3024 length:2298 start_codon:yes stop_codon:yes gene_type:complete
MVASANLGFPRIGANRELKRALESYWSGKIELEALQQVAKDIRTINWQLQLDAGIDHIPSNDFSMYDQVLDTAIMLNAIPDRFTDEQFDTSEELYFAMARGLQTDDIDVTPLEMTKWFDTNYHYLVPELSEKINFSLNPDKLLNEFNEAKQIGITSRPVIIGPMTFLKLSKFDKSMSNQKEYLDKLVPLYSELLGLLNKQGCEWVQIDEPILVTDLTEEEKNNFQDAYRSMTSQANVKIMLTTYFGSIIHNIDLITSMNIDGLHLDCVHGSENLEIDLSKFDNSLVLSLGIVDGRNIWINDLQRSIKLLQSFVNQSNLKDVVVSPSCSLLHSPIDLSLENKIDEEIKSWMSFATNKIDEVAVIKNVLNLNENQKSEDVKSEYWMIDTNTKAIQNRSQSPKVNNPVVQDRVKNISYDMKNRESDYTQRAKIQKDALNLPILPTTTIGSFPQTKEVRQKRSQFKQGNLSLEEYESFLLNATKDVIELQDDIGIDVLVHGEFERNDMVEYFGEQLDGFVFSENGWVQSYGSRCVKPPIIFGDVYRKNPMTIDWITKAQSFTDKHVKGMLTGPVTILQWSFVRDDQSRQTTCEQIAFAIRDEVDDLVSNNVKIIQIDEPALREGLPLKASNQVDYLAWAVDCFKIASSSVSDDIQIHTHMCYAEFNEIMDAIIKLDADVISIEASRSSMELLNAFSNNDYPNEIGPGVYDIHSPRIPPVSEIQELISTLVSQLPLERLWINPDCGLKTRGWDEVKVSLKNMVTASSEFR